MREPLGCAQSRGRFSTLRLPILLLPLFLGGCVGYRAYEAPELELVAREVASRVEEIRGQRLRSLVQVREVSAAELMGVVDERLALGHDGERLEREVAAYERLGLYEPGRGGADNARELMASHLVGYYDPIRDRLGLVRQSLEFGRLEIGLARELVLAHEFTHALQDQRRDLYGFLDEGWERGADGHLANLAVIEGEAQAVMYAFVLSGSGKSLGDVEGALGDAILAGLDPMLDRNPDLGSGRQASVMEGRMLLFPYYAGATFIQEVHRAGGWPAVDELFAAGRVHSTEQVLHPVKFLGRPDLPVQILLPDDALPGYDVFHEDTLGELGLRVLLERSLDTASATAAAIGWDGDRLRCYRDARGDLSYVWVLRMDSDADAAELFAAFDQALPRQRQGARRLSLEDDPGGTRTRWLAGRDTIAFRWQGREVRVHDGFATGLHPEVEALLAARRIQHHPLDHDRGAGDAASTREEEARILGAERQAAARRVGMPSIEGDTLVDPSHGFSLSRPDNDLWHFLPLSPAGVTRARLQRVDDLDVEMLLPNRYAGVDVIPLSLPLELEQIVHQIERQLAFSLHNFRRLSREEITYAGQRAVELRYRGTLGGEAMRFRQITFLEGGKQWNLTAASPVGTYEQDAADLDEILRSFTLD